MEERMAETRESTHESGGGLDADRGQGATSRLYRIRVEGTLDPSWSPRLSGLRISPADHAEGGAASVLEGILADRASLIGVLNAIHDMNMELLSVETLKAGTKSSHTPSKGADHDGP
jgi:hypothetical protein